MDSLTSIPLLSYVDSFTVLRRFLYYTLTLLFLFFLRSLVGI